MSESKLKKQSVDSNVASGSVVQKKFRIPLTKHTVLILLALAVLVGLGFAWHEINKVPTRQEIIMAENKGQYAKAIQMLNKLIPKTSSKSTKAQLYIELGSDYGNSNQASKAIEAYTQAANINGWTPEAARSIADAYLNQRNKTQAIVYYQKAIDTWPKHDPLRSVEIQALKQTIKDLQK